MATSPEPAIRAAHIMPGTQRSKQPPTEEAQTSVDRRKRQKLSHTPETRGQGREAIADAVDNRIRSQESGSSDQSASKWFESANKHFRGSQREPSHLDGMDL